MLFTGKGDDGTTSAYGSSKRFSKDSPIAHALGTLDEVNSLLGVCKVKSEFTEIVDEMQQNLFIIQAEVAGADKTISKEKVQDLEEIINRIEKELPKIDSFFVSGSCESSALFDHARSVSRRAEREVVKIKESVGEDTLAYLNRLSSLLYALARLSAHKNDITESAPTYE